MLISDTVIVIHICNYSQDQNHIRNQANWVESKLLNILVLFHLYNILYKIGKTKKFKTLLILNKPNIQPEISQIAGDKNNSVRVFQ